MLTRATNAKKHPGKIVLDSSTRRPKEVVRAERMSKVAEKERIQAAQEEGIKEVAQIENDARKKKHPRLIHQKIREDELTIPRRTRTRSPLKRAATPANQGKQYP